MQHIDWLIILIGTGFALLGIGFNYRDKNWGVALIALGVLTMFSTITFKLYITLNH